MKKVVHRKDSRGSANHGWLKVNHSFSFANYFNPLRMGFGVLRVLNDDTVAPQMGFGMHPHNDMEIITIPLAGSLKHRDNMGNEAVIQAGEVQVMSAGSGLIHSEINSDPKEEVNLFQIWILPQAQNVTPRYDQKRFDALKKKNTLTTVVSPESETHNEALWIHQQAFIHLGNFDAGQTLEYPLKKSVNGLYLMVINGSLSLADETLNTRDAIGISGVEHITLSTASDTSFLLLEVPMQ